MPTMTLNASESNTWNDAKVLGVHPRVIGNAKLWQQLANKEGKEFWTLRLCKVKVNVVSTEVHNCVVNWWLFKLGESK